VQKSGPWKTSHFSPSAFTSLITVAKMEAWPAI